MLFREFLQNLWMVVAGMGNQDLIFSQVNTEHAEIVSSETTQRVHPCDILLDYLKAYSDIFL